jgi:single-stranded-DNA-specific exonuclease
MRSQEGFNVMKALAGLDAYLVRSGGHAFAGGLSIKKTDLEAFSKELLFDALKFQINPPKTKRIPLELDECTLENYRLIRTFGPFGMEWKEPDFLLCDIASQSLTFTRDGHYLSTSLPGGVRLFSFKLSSAEVATSQSLNLLAHFALNEYKGRTSLDILVEKA